MGTRREGSGRSWRIASLIIARNRAREAPLSMRNYTDRTQAHSVQCYAASRAIPITSGMVECSAGSESRVSASWASPSTL